MPQFETEPPGGGPPAVLRATDAADAVRRALGLPPETPVDLGAPAPRDAWAEATAGGAPAGRVRPHARMRFRRD